MLLHNSWVKENSKKLRSILNESENKTYQNLWKANTIHGILQARITGVGCHNLLQGIFLIQGLNPHLLCLLYWQVSHLPLAPLGKPSPPDFLVHGILHERIQVWVSCPPPRDLPDPGIKPVSLTFVYLLIVAS